MVTHCYDSSTDSIEIQGVRLKPARAITNAGVPCLVWAEDALSFVHFVPTCLFSLQILVPDALLEAATSLIVSNLPYKRMVEPPESWQEYMFINRSRPICFPNSIHLKLSTPDYLRSEDNTQDVYIHPQSSFSIDVREQNLSVSLVPPLPPPNANIRFPTRTAFIDSLVTTILEPPIGYHHWKLIRTLQVYLGYFFTYPLRADPSVLPNGQLEPEHASVWVSLKEENKPYFDAQVRGTSKGWLPDVQAQRAALEKAG